MRGITGIREGLLEYARDYWSIQGITGICERLLEYASDYWIMQRWRSIDFHLYLHMDKLPTPASQQLVSVNEGRVRVISVLIFRSP